MLLGLRVPTRKGGSARKLTETPFPIILRTLARPMLPLAVLMAIHIFMRGHNLPGGGFVAGLVLAIAFAMQYLANGKTWSSARISINYRRMIAIGMLLAIATGLGGLLFGSNFLRHAHGHVDLPVVGDIELATAMLFDTGVLLAVLGAVLQQVTGIGQLSRQSFDTREYTPEEHPWKA
jgi:multicomponent K+:H+ antiporter subunit A